MPKKKDNILNFPSPPTKVERQVEAILFAASEPLDIETIEKRIQINTNIKKILENIKNIYKQRGINLVCIKNKWSFRTAEDLSKLMSLQKSTQKKLSKATIETLAIIVYHQPITKAEIESIRGVNIGQGIFDQLMELGWIAPGGRKEVPGRPILWETTDDFLLHFGLGTLDNLPGIEEMKSSGLLNDNFASMNIQELTDDLDNNEAFVEEENDEDENLDDFTQSQLTQNNDT